MAKKDKIAIALGLLRSNSSPTFFALLPQVRPWLVFFSFVNDKIFIQEEREDEGGWRDPAGFHLIPIPFADDIRAAPIDEAALGMFYHAFGSGELIISLWRQHLKIW